MTLSERVRVLAVSDKWCSVEDLERVSKCLGKSNSQIKIDLICQAPEDLDGRLRPTVLSSRDYTYVCLVALTKTMEVPLSRFFARNGDLPLRLIFLPE
jgi:hypothetical protein